MSVVSLSPSESDVETVLRAFLLFILPNGIEVIAGLDNKVPEPEGSDFVITTPIRRRRISTNVDSYADCLFTGSIAGQILTIVSTTYGIIIAGATIFGVGIAANTTAVRKNPGGTWLLSNSQTVAKQVMAAGTQELQQSTEITFQVDVHGPNSADNAQTITTLFRDEVAVDFFIATMATITPLHADDPKQIPFENDQQQIEMRWVIEALVQADQVVTIAQQFADEVMITPVAVQAAFPA